MTTNELGIGLVTLWMTPTTSADSAADSVTFRDGQVLLGQVLESDRRGPLRILVRRTWAKTNLPDRLANWEKSEAPLIERAEAQRRGRLQDWRRDRHPDPNRVDRITPWLDREMALRNEPKPKLSSPLMVVSLSRADVRAIDRKSSREKRLLRLGWLSNLPDVESIPRNELAQGLEGRGFDPDAVTLVAVDSLLPIQTETDAQWLVRRASTEVTNDPGSRWLRYQGLILPEPSPGEAPPAGASLAAALGTLKELLGEAPVDPLPDKLRELAGQGRVGAILTQLDLAPDFSSVSVKTTLLVRAGVDRWLPAIVHSSNVRLDDLPANAGDGLADDPQVKAVFGIVESLGLGEAPPELKRRSLNMGAATRKALSQVRASLDQELNAAALSLETTRDPRP